MFTAMALHMIGVVVRGPEPILWEFEDTANDIILSDWRLPNTKLKM